MKPTTYLLVDFENLQPPPEHFAQVRGDDRHLWVFHGPHQNKFAAELVKAWKPLGDRLEFVQSSKTGKNALDFHLAFYLGLLHERNVAAKRAARYVVITGDGGFEAIFSHMRELGCAVDKAACIPEALALLTASINSHQSVAATEAPSPTNAAPAKSSMAKAPASRTLRRKPQAGDADKIVAALQKSRNNRPVDRAALERYAVAALCNKVSPDVGKAAVNVLQQRKVVAFDGNKVQYRIPEAPDEPG